ncbi:MAG: hypothetical protein A2Y97_04635 [Nitrospirae bacterium RBG_13_39_12]|nr:MAG: hypothetical protein A2Y97_04635 [Nitrospirae bacterium RBG_13_39_12]
MIKKIIIITTTFLFIISGIHVYAGPIIGQEEYKQKMNGHIEKMKLKNPQKYQEMMQKTGGNITNCIDCHKEILNKNLPPIRGKGTKG